MDWFVFAILAPATLALVNILDKMVISKHVKDEYAYVFLSGMIYFAYVILVSFLVPIQSSFPYNAIAILTGVLGTLIYVLYIKSLKQEEASRVVTLFYIFPIFIVILARIFLNEILTPQKYVGIALIVTSIVLVSWRRKDGKMSLTPVIKYILPLSILFGISDVLDRFLLGHMDYWSLFVLVGVGVPLGRIFMLGISSVRKRIISNLAKLNARILLLVMLVEAMSLVGFLFFYIAVSMQYVSIVGSVEALQPFFVLFYTVVLSLFMPKILREEVTRKTIVLKSFAVMLVFAGTYLVVI